MEEQLLIKVDVNDNPTGEIGKQEAHEKGILHRAYSVFIFDAEGRWLLQRRALHKYHSAGLWSNACCSHPAPGEQTLLSAQKRLTEEMGLKCALNNIFNFTYKTDLKNGLIEHEFDHVFTGTTNSDPLINTEEVAEWKLVTYNQLEKLVANNPEEFTEWFKMIYEKVHHHVNFV